MKKLLLTILALAFASSVYAMGTKPQPDCMQKWGGKDWVCYTVEEYIPIQETQVVFSKDNLERKTFPYSRKDVREGHYRQIVFLEDLKSMDKNSQVPNTVKYFGAQKYQYSFKSGIVIGKCENTKCQRAVDLLESE